MAEICFPDILSVYIIQSLHAGALPLTHPRAPPLNVKKIAVKKVSDIDVVIFGPEL